jgi:hypothetical protein
MKRNWAALLKEQSTRLELKLTFASADEPGYLRKPHFNAPLEVHALKTN